MNYSPHQREGWGRAPPWTRLHKPPGHDDSKLPEDSTDIADLATQLSTPLSEGPGTQIGPYKLLEQLGEGGFGVVWAAEQREPVKQRVALKIIKIGMDTKEVVARFEAERQALAVMEHPNIAMVLDAGAAETGRPYFVMEAVRGILTWSYKIVLIHTLLIAVLSCLVHLRLWPILESRLFGIFF